MTALEAVWGETVAEFLESDNSAAVQAIEASHSRKMACLSRTQKISLGLLHDYIDDDLRDIGLVGSADNDGDIFTKGLDVIVFE